MNSIIDTITGSNAIFFTILGVLLIIIIVMILLIRKENKAASAEIKKEEPKKTEKEPLDEKQKVLETNEIEDTVVISEDSLATPENSLPEVEKNNTIQIDNLVVEDNHVPNENNSLTSLNPVGEEVKEPEPAIIPGSVGEAEDKELEDQIDSFLPRKVSNNDETIDEEISEDSIVSPEQRIESEEKVEPIIPFIEEEPEIDLSLNTVINPEEIDDALKLEPVKDPSTYGPTLAETMEKLKEEKESNTEEEHIPTLEETLNKIKSEKEQVEEEIVNDMPSLADTYELIKKERSEESEESENETEEESHIPSLEETLKKIKEEKDDIKEDISISAPTLAETMKKLLEEKEIPEEEKTEIEPESTEPSKEDLPIINLQPVGEKVEEEYVSRLTMPIPTDEIAKELENEESTIDAPTLAETMEKMQEEKEIPEDEFIDLGSDKEKTNIIVPEFIQEDEEPEEDEGYYEYEDDNEEEVEGVPLSELSNEVVTDDKLNELKEQLSNIEPKKVEMTPYEVEQEEKAIISYEELVHQKDNVSIEYQDEDNPNPEVDIKQVDLEKTGRIELDPIKKAMNSKVENNQYEHEEDFLDTLKQLNDLLK